MGRRYARAKREEDEASPLNSKADQKEFGSHVRAGAGNCNEERISFEPIMSFSQSSEMENYFDERKRTELLEKFSCRKVAKEESM